MENKASRREYSSNFVLDQGRNGLLTLIIKGGVVGVSRPFQTFFGGHMGRRRTLVSLLYAERRQ